MYNATASNMQGRTSIYMDKTNYVARFTLENVYAYLRSYRDFDFHTLLADLQEFADEYKITVGQADMSKTFPTFSIFFGKKSNGDDIGIRMAIPFGTDEDGNKFDIYLIGQLLSDTELDAYLNGNYGNSNLPTVPSVPSNPPNTDGSESSGTFEDHTFAVFRGSTYDWEDYRDDCISRGGHLAIIDSAEKDAYVYSLLQDLGYDSAYFGLYREKDDTSKWYWVDGTPVEYTNWGDGEPNNESNSEYYGMYYTAYQDGKWNDGTPSVTAGNDTYYICEWDYK